MSDDIDSHKDMLGLTGCLESESRTNVKVHVDEWFDERKTYETCEMIIKYFKVRGVPSFHVKNIFNALSGSW